MLKINSLSWATLCEKCPNTEFFLVCIFYIQPEYGGLRSKSPHSVRIQENMDQKKLRIWTHFTQCKSHSKSTEENSWRKVTLLKSLFFMVILLNIYCRIDKNVFEKNSGGIFSNVNQLKFSCLYFLFLYEALFE